MDADSRRQGGLATRTKALTKRLRQIVRRARKTGVPFGRTFIELVGILPPGLEFTAWDVKCWSGLWEPANPREWGDNMNVAVRKHKLQYVRSDKCRRPSREGGRTGVWRKDEPTHPDDR